MSKCFIIMPISTPDFAIPKYNGDADHFKHVLDHLFVPALTDAGFEPIPPVCEGAELIQAAIIERLVESDFVLCDMSCLNPNVFFELGIRTALNKPMCLVKDDTTDSVPFDTNIINNHTYRSALNTWELAADVERLSTHAKETLSRGDDGNSMWKYFGLSATAQPATDAQPGDDLKYLSLQMEAMRKQVADLADASRDNARNVDPLAAKLQLIAGYAARHGAKEFALRSSDDARRASIHVKPGSLTEIDKARLKAYARRKVGISLEIDDR